MENKYLNEKLKKVEKIEHKTKERKTNMEKWKTAKMYLEFQNKKVMYWQNNRGVWISKCRFHYSLFSKNEWKNWKGNNETFKNKHLNEKLKKVEKIKRNKYEKSGTYSEILKKKQQKFNLDFKAKKMVSLSSYFYVHLHTNFRHPLHIIFPIFKSHIQ